MEALLFTRRDALKTFGAAGVASIGGFRQVEDRNAVLAAIAEVVLPAEADRKAAVAAFAAWIDNYKEGADTDHGYGNTRIRATGPSPARNYPAQIAALDSAAKAKGSLSFAVALVGDRRAIIEQSIAAAGIDRLPARPTGGHVATDLMGHYLYSAAAEDLCYRASIARDACRGLAGSDQPPRPLRSSASGPRTTDHATRSPVPDPRSLVSDPRSPVSGRRSPVPGPRSPVPDPRP